MGRYPTPEESDLSVVVSRRITFPLVLEPVIAEVLGILGKPTAWYKIDGADIVEVLTSLSGLWSMVDEVGSIRAYLRDDCPVGHLPCDGSSYPLGEWPRLAAVLPASLINTSAGTFTVPDLSGRSLVGDGFPPGFSTPAAVGETYGTSAMNLSEDELPEHTHFAALHGHAYVGASPSVVTVGAGAPVPVAVPAPMVTDLAVVSIENAGASNPFPIYHPVLAVKYCIVAQ